MSIWSNEITQVDVVVADIQHLHNLQQSKLWHQHPAKRDVFFKSCHFLVTPGVQNLRFKIFSMWVMVKISQFSYTCVLVLAVCIVFHVRHVSISCFGILFYFCMQSLIMLLLLYFLCMYTYVVLACTST